MSIDNAIEQAAHDLEAIRSLQKPGSAFQSYYLRRLNGKIEELTHSILHDRTLSAHELEGKRNQLWGLEELRDMPERDRQACLKLDRSEVNG